LAAAALLFTGCPKPLEPPANSAPPHPAVVRLAVVGDPALAKQIARVKGEWKARSGADIEIREMSVEELSAAKPLATDAVIYPADELGSLAERGSIRPLSAAWLERGGFRKSEVFEPGGLAEAQWGEQTYAIPFGSPVFVVFYRRDLFDRFHLAPPRTWADYQRLIESFGDHKKDLPELSAAAFEPLASGWAGRVLLARAAAYAKHRDYYATLFDNETMAPQIASLPFVRALEELVAAAKSNAAACLAATPAEARRAFLSGQCTMAMSWPTAADSSSGLSAESRGPNPESVLPGFAELPGSTEVYSPKTKSWQLLQADDSSDPRSAISETRVPSPVSRVPLLAISGRLGSVAKESASGEFAFQLLAWLSGDEWSGQICPASPATTLFRRVHLGQPGRWVEPQIPPAAAKEYAEVVVHSFSQSQWLESPRIPGHAEYMSALDDAVRSAVEGKQSAAEALNSAADRWRAITTRIGLDSQRAAYTRSLGLEP
jgi:multiple sugar transport system substrate-binding protein